MFDIKLKEISVSQNTNSGRFQSLPFWCEFKACHGWIYKRFFIDWSYTEDEKSVKKTAEFSVLFRSFAKNLFTIAYVPLFPTLPFDCVDEKKLDSAISSEQQVSVISEEIVTAQTQSIEAANFINELAFLLKDFLPKNTICVRFDPDIEFSTPDERDQFNYGFQLISFADKLNLRKTKVDIQPPDSTRVCLTLSEEEILSNMKSKWRYNINLAKRKGVEIECIDRKSVNMYEKLDIFYKIYDITAKRDGISLHSKSYYRDLLEKSFLNINENKDVPEIRLYLAKHENDYLGGIITLFSKDESVYLYGASSNEKRNLMPNFLLQWTAMNDAKAYGSKYYDLYGMPPTDDENHPMHGLYLFKTGFGGKNYHRIGTFDVKLKWIYSYFVLAENLRAFWHKKVLKKIRGR